MDRLDYASDTVAMAPKGPLVLLEQNLAATGDANFGYFGGGVKSLMIQWINSRSY